MSRLDDDIVSDFLPPDFDEDTLPTWKGRCICGHTAESHLQGAHSHMDDDGYPHVARFWACFGEEGPGGLPPTNAAICNCEEFKQIDGPIIGIA